MTFHWPQVTFIVMQTLIVVLTTALHGVPRTDRWNAWHAVGNFAFNTWLLWCGGFFG